MWPHTVAVDALAVGRQLHEAADDLLVPLLLPPAPHVSTGLKAETTPRKNNHPERKSAETESPRPAGPESASPGSAGATDSGAGEGDGGPAARVYWRVGGGGREWRPRRRV